MNKNICNILNILIVLSIYISVVFSDTLVNNEKPFIKVHLICHSHQDAGWLKSFEEYYKQDVNTILTHVVDALTVNSMRKFVISDIGFVDRWWNVVPSDYTNRFVKFVQNGQIEIINGGWVMNDEACPTVDDVIRQLSEGHKFIVEKFGKDYLPRSGWQIDPFGHSSVTPYLQSLMGYNHIILDRLHYKHKDQLKKQKDLQFIWKNSASKGLQSHTNMLSHVLDDFYFSPPHLSFESESNLDFYHLQYNVNDITQYAQEKAAFFKSPHILIPIGGDFHFRNAEKWMDRIDQIETKMKSEFEEGKSNVYAVYSNLKDFFNDTVTWHQKHNATFKYFDEDFLPYADNDAQYWTGYFTSRPHLKGEIREVSSLLRSAEIFSTLYPNKISDIESKLSSASKNLSILQHHDAVTGTARVAVVDDYSSRLSDAGLLSNDVLSKSISSHLNLQVKLNTIDFNKVQTEYINISEYDTIGLVLVNSLNWEQNSVFNVKISNHIPSGNNQPQCPFKVFSDSKYKVEIPFDCSIKRERMIESNLKGDSIYHQLDFLVNLPPFGSKTYFIKHCKPNEINHSKLNWVKETKEVPDEQVFFNKFMRIKFKSSNSLIESVQLFDKDLVDKKDDFILLNQKLMYYNDKGGAYVFQLEKEGDLALEPDRYNITRYYWGGNLVKEAHIYFKDKFSGVSQQTVESCIKIRMFNSSLQEIDKNIEFNFIVESKQHSTSVIRFTSGMRSDGIYTDNGIELLKRPIANNQFEPHKLHFPSVSIVMMKDEKSNLSFVCNHDRTKGVGGLKSGEFEFALHRHLDLDDNKGLEIPNKDSQPINVKSQCYFTKHQSSKPNSIRKDSLSFTHQTKSYYYTVPNNNHNYNTTLSLISNSHDNIYILSLESTKKQGIFNIRIMNIQETGEPVKINTSLLFNKPIEIIQQNDLSHSRKFDQFHSHDDYYKSIPSTNSTIFSTNNNFNRNYNEETHYEPIDKDTIISLLPLEIKSFTFKFIN